MKLKRSFVFSMLLVSVLLLHCGGDDETPPTTPTGPDLLLLEVVASSPFTVASHPKAVTLKVQATYDNGDKRFISDYSMLIDGEDQGRAQTFESDEAGEFELKAKVGEVESAAYIIEVRPALELETRPFQIIFHIVHDGEPLGEGYNIDASRIDYQMELLEKTFERPLSVTPNSTQPMMDFELATTDPQGNLLAEPGINRLQRPGKDASVLFQDWMWDHYWDPDFYINVWVGDTKNGFSWGIYPSLQCSDEDDGLEGLGCQSIDYPDQLEGIALELDNLWEENWVFPHEMGHVFGLFHIFDGGVCDRDVDHCADTQQYSRDAYSTSGESSDRFSCDGQIFTSYNVMDYWKQPDGLRDLSYDQVLRMRKVIEQGNFRGTKSLSEGTPREMVNPRGG